MMNFLGVIPARGDSKGIPRKNLVLLKGKPLLSYTCEAAKSAKLLNRVLLSTDDEEIAAAGKTFGVDVPFLRPKNLAQDDTPILDVLQDLLKRLDGAKPDAVVLLQPTSPLRNGKHIDAAIELFQQSGADTVVSVMTVPHHFSPACLMVLDGERVKPLTDGPMILRRQDKQKVYARNGPAIFICKTSLIEKGIFYGDDIRPFVMDHQSSVDIDDVTDLKFAEFLMK